MKLGGVSLDAKKKVIGQFSQSAESYLTSHVHAKGKDLKWIEDQVKRISPKRALDIATGAGHTAFLLGCYSQQVLALDLTAKMLKIAIAEAENRGISNISFVIGDAEALPFIDGYFDLVTCRIAAHHFPHVEKAVQEMYRILCRQGVLILIDNVVPDEPKTAELINKLEKWRDPSHERCLSVNEWSQLFRETGFADIRLEHTWTTSLDMMEWLNRAKTPDSNRKKIFELIEKADQKALVNKQTLSLQKGMWICGKS
jgi:SAM-dependent methyltransferase